MQNDRDDYCRHDTRFNFSFFYLNDILQLKKKSKTTEMIIVNMIQDLIFPFSI